MNSVQIVPNEKTGNVINAYVSNPDVGYIQLQSKAVECNGSWMRTVKRNALIKGDVETLKEFVDNYPSLQLPGQIVIKEYLQSEVPAAIAKQFFRSDVTEEEAIEPYVKRAGADGPELTFGGERILRFSIWDMSGEDTDHLQPHDNQDAVKAFREANADSAQLGNG